MISIQKKGMQCESNPVTIGLTITRVGGMQATYIPDMCKDCPLLGDCIDESKHAFYKALNTPVGCI